MIDNYQFGSMVVGGKQYRNDLKMIQGKVIAHWWRSQGHSVAVCDVGDIFAARPEVLVVGTGKPGRMRVEDPLRSALAQAGIELIEQPTAVAVETFNRLWAEGKNVAGAFHLTC